jgi:hypothetical protein
MSTTNGITGPNEFVQYGENEHDLPTNDDRVDRLDPRIVADERRVPDKYDAPRLRETTECRDHHAYEKPWWTTVHVDDVDNAGAFTHHDALTNEVDVRVDLDGFGDGHADAHDKGENVQVSFWLTPEMARELGAELLARAGQADTEELRQELDEARDFTEGSR